MRLLIVALLAALSSPASAVAIHSQGRATGSLKSSPDCPQTTSVYAFDREKTVRPQKLTELPDANAYKAVFRHIGRCEVPVIVRFGISGR